MGVMSGTRNSAVTAVAPRYVGPGGKDSHPVSNGLPAHTAQHTTHLWVQATALSEKPCKVAGHGPAANSLLCQPNVQADDPIELQLLTSLSTTTVLLPVQEFRLSSTAAGGHEAQQSAPQ